MVGTGIDGLDTVIGGGFPKGSLILLAGNPGTGKTAFSARFIAKGAESDEPGIYVSFAEAEDTLIENLSGHLNIDLTKFQLDRKIKILDYTAMREMVTSTILDEILREVQLLKAQRLVVDSYSSLAQAFQKSNDARIALNIIFGRIVRQLNCTTLMVVEVPQGSRRVGMGVEEFVADGAIMLRVRTLDGRLLRELEIRKMRGVKISERKLVFTLSGGFKAFPPFTHKKVGKIHRFDPIPDPPGKYSTGSIDMDEILGGGFSVGDSVLLEIGDEVSMAEYHLIVVPTIVNFISKGRAVLLIPTLGVDAEKAKQIGLSYGLTDDEINGLLKVCVAKTLGGDSDKPYMVAFEAKNPWEDYSKYLKIEEELNRKTGQPVMSVSGADTMISYYDESTYEKILGQDAIRIRKHNSIGIVLLKAGYESLSRRLGSVATTHLKIVKENGCLLFYAVKPRTGLYAVEMDVSKGYPTPKFTPMV
ncbi:MAG: ATPase domain-containing protein [Candidatus Bathyarchaeia archaeon]